MTDDSSLHTVTALAPKTVLVDKLSTILENLQAPHAEPEQNKAGYIAFVRSLITDLESVSNGSIRLKFWQNAFNTAEKNYYESRIPLVQTDEQQQSFRALKRDVQSAFDNTLATPIAHAQQNVNPIKRIAFSAVVAFPHRVTPSHLLEVSQFTLDACIADENATPGVTLPVDAIRYIQNKLETEIIPNSAISTMSKDAWDTLFDEALKEHPCSDVGEHNMRDAIYRNAAFLSRPKSQCGNIETAGNLTTSPLLSL